MGSLVDTFLQGQPPFHRVSGAVRTAFLSFQGNVEDLLLGKTEADLPDVDVERVAKASAFYRAAHAQHRTKDHLINAGLDEATAGLLSEMTGAHNADWFDKNPFIAAGTLGWSAVARLRTSLGIGTDDPRFTGAAVDFALRQKDEQGDGDTIFSYDNLVEALVPLLGSDGNAHQAIEHAWNEGRLSWCNAHNGGYQSIALAAMEQALAEWADRSTVPPFEGRTTHGTQQDAIRLVLRHRIALVHGSAGTGKTTLLGALVEAARKKKRRVFLIALAAKAARRIEEETQHPAMTIERFLLLAPKLRLRSSDIVVVDEAGMLCVADLYRLVRTAGGCSIALVGDPVQLPPVQSGRPFLDMLLSRRLPTVWLRQVYRQASGNPILDFALAVRAGRTDEAMGILEGGDARLTYIDADGAAVLPHLVRHHAAHTHTSNASHTNDFQILAAVKDGPAGVHAINSLLSRAACSSLATTPPVFPTPSAPGSVILGTLHGRNDIPVGAPVVVTKNLPTLGLDNGALGVVYGSREILFPSGIVYVSPDLLEALDLAYALTIHKAQGSQWRDVALVVGRSRLLDRSLLYTAATRAAHSLLVVGPRQAIVSAISTPPKVSGLSTTLLHRIGSLS